MDLKTKDLGFRKLKSELAQHMGLDHLALHIIPEKQELLIEDISEVIFSDISTQVLSDISDIVYHLIRFGYTEEIQDSALEALSLIRDLEMLENNDKVQSRIFNMLRLLIEPKNFQLNKKNLKAQKEFLPFIYSKSTYIRKLFTIFLLDNKSNGYTHISNLPESCMQDKGFRIQLCKNIIEILLNGKLEYSRINNELPHITSEDILLYLINFYFNGKLGLETELLIAEDYFEIMNQLILCKDQKEYKERVLKQPAYFEHLNYTCSKFYIKYSSTIEKAFQKLSLQAHTAKDDFIGFIDITEQHSRRLNLINHPKINKARIKSLEILTEIQNKIQEI